MSMVFSVLALNLYMYFLIKNKGQDHTRSRSRKFKVSVTLIVKSIESSVLFVFLGMLVDLSRIKINVI